MVSGPGIDVKLKERKKERKKDDTISQFPYLKMMPRGTLKIQIAF